MNEISFTKGAKYPSLKKNEISFEWKKKLCKMDEILFTVNPLGLWRTRYHFGTSFIRKNPHIQRRKNEKSFDKRKKTSYNE